MRTELVAKIFRGGRGSNKIPVININDSKENAITYSIDKVEENSHSAMLFCAALRNIRIEKIKKRNRKLSNTMKTLCRLVNYDRIAA